jgi:hypothetical protein
MVQARLSKSAMTRVLCYLWVALLAFSFFVTLRHSRYEALRTEEYAYACDPFGYLRMAKQIRQSFSRVQWPQFKLESAQTRTLINFMQEKQVPLSRWEEVVAPHAHHYFPRAGYVGVQYPPGTGLVMAIFPQGEALYRLNQIVVSVFGLLGLVALLVAAWKRAWRSIALVILGVCLALLVLARISTTSFSINAVLVPVLFTCLLSFLAVWLNNRRHDRLALISAFLAGVSLGLATLIRLPAFLLLPGFVILLWPGFRRLLRFTSLPLALAVGATIAGVLPVLINQQKVAGAWYLSTYASVDAAAPTAAAVRSNLSYFFGNGPAAADNWAVVFAIAGFAGFVILQPKRDATNPATGMLSWQRLALAAAVLWLVPTTYFLTHWITGPHYMIPSVFATVALLGIGAFCLELGSNTRFDPRRVVSWVALVLILAPGLAVVSRAFPIRSRPPGVVTANTHTPIILPAELADDKAWIWADLLTGSLWYYANKPAFKIQFTDEQTRAMIFRFVFDRHEPQYLIQDSEQMKKYMDEIKRLGGKLEMRGKVDGQPYFLIVWPGEGPR